MNAKYECCATTLVTHHTFRNVLILKATFKNIMAMVFFNHCFINELSATHEWNVSLLCCSQKIPAQSFSSSTVNPLSQSWVNPIVNENNTRRNIPRNFPKSCNICPIEICKHIHYYQFQRSNSRLYIKITHQNFYTSK